MKQQILCALLLLLLLSSCRAPQSFFAESSALTADKQTAQTNLDTANTEPQTKEHETVTSPVSEYTEPYAETDEPNAEIVSDSASPPHDNASFLSADDLCANLLSRLEVLSNLPNTPVTEEFTAFCDARKAENTVAFPHLDGDLIPLRTDPNYAIITVFTREAYNLPCFFFHAEIDGEIIIIKTMYLDNPKNLSIADERDPIPLLTRLDVIHEDEQTNLFEDRVLADRTVRMHIRLAEDDPQIYYHFVYDNLLVSMITIDPLSDAFLARLSFADLPLTATE